MGGDVGSMKSRGWGTHDGIRALMRGETRVYKEGGTRGHGKEAAPPGGRSAAPALMFPASRWKGMDVCCLNLQGRERSVTEAWEDEDTE